MMNSALKNWRNHTYHAFTLIEILVAIALIALLVTITTVAINPGKSLKEARNVARQENLKSLHDALYMLQLDGTNINSIKQANGSDITLCSVGSDDIVTGTSFTAGEVNLYSLLVDGNYSYLEDLPVDPSAEGNDTGIDICDRGTSQTSYLLTSPLAELGEIFEYIVQDTNSVSEVIPDFIVNSSDFVDDGTCDETHCSLREAIDAANSKANVDGPDVIHFNIPGDGPFTIAATTPLPKLNESVVIDASTQSGASCRNLWDGSGQTLKVELDGTLSDGGQYQRVLEVMADDITIKGLSITNYTGSGVFMDERSGITIECNYFGLSPDNTGTSANLGVGIYIVDSTDVEVRRNVISNSNKSGVSISGDLTETVLIAENFIGTDATGMTNEGNSEHGISYRVTSDSFAEDVTIGGSTGNKNLISANSWSGAYVVGGVKLSEVSYNIIGFTRDESAALGNGVNGVQVLAQGYDPNNLEISYNTIGNSNRGIYVYDTRDSIFSHNMIGVDSTGSGSFGNTSAGIYLRVGGTTYLKDNTIASNTIKNNGSAGISINRDASALTSNVIRNKFSQNVIENNSGLGIAMWTSEVSSGNGTPNDDLTNSLFPNLAIDYPIIDNGSVIGSVLTVDGSIGSTGGLPAYAGGLVELFKANDDGDQNFEIIDGDTLSVPHGEASAYIGSCTVDSDGTFGTVTGCSLTIPGGVTLTTGDAIVGTFTDITNNTSEFGANFTL